MFKIKKPAIILVLMVLLVFTGYINHKLTQQSFLKASNDYQSHEEMEMSKKTDDDKDESAEVVSKKDKKDNIKKDDMEIIDTKTNKNVSNLSKEVNSDISKTLSKDSSSKSKNYFIEQRLARDKLRGGLTERLNEIVNNEKTGDEVRKEAQKEIIKIGNISEKELHIEGLITAKGFDDAIVFLSDEEARVVVSAQDLPEKDMVKILDIVKSETELDTRQIKIMKKN